MNARSLFAVALAGVVAAGCDLTGNEVEQHAGVVAASCLDCHNSAEAVGGLDLESRSLEEITADAETWEAVLKKLRAGLMPPADGPGIDRRDRDALVAFQPIR